jgi:GntR family transcriptional regulator/MocR family aminotransferase
MRAPFGSNNLELLNHGAAPPDLLPLSQWRRALQHRNATLNGAELESLSEPFGYRPLREAIAGYIQRFKGIDCHADQLIVMAEATQLQDMLAKMLLDPGDGVVLENPGCSRLRALLLSYGARLHPIVVDENGMVTNELFRVSSNCKFAFVTPAHHVPTGAVMSLDRRRKLLAWAKQTDAFVIEDGADSDFRYGSQPVPPIHKLDDQDLVIYLYSFWKTLFPLTGIACLVIPPALVATFEKIASLSRHSIPIVEAIALSELINSGNLERHIRKTWSEYTKRRQALIFALAQNFKSSVTYFKESSGHHLLVRFAAGPTEEQLLVSAAETNLPMISTQDWYAEGAEPREFLIPFALLSTKDIANAVSEFARRVNTLAQQCHPTASSHSVTSEVLIHPSVSTTENLPIG